MNTQDTSSIKKLSFIRDLRIRGRLFVEFVKLLGGIPVAPGQHIVIARFVPAMLILVLVFGGLPWFGYETLHERGNTMFLKRAYAKESARLESRESALLFEHIIVEEGKDKAAYVAMKSGLPLSEVSQVPLRKDELKYWAYSHHQKSEISSTVPGTPIKTHLFYATSGKLHIFDDAPTDCALEKKRGMVGVGCEQTPKDPETLRAHRALFDQAHDLGSVYAFATDHTVEHPIFSLDLVPSETDVPGMRAYTYAPNASTSVLILFDEETLLPRKEVISVITGGRTYEMSVIHHLETETEGLDMVPAVFDPAARPYVERVVVPLP